MDTARTTKVIADEVIGNTNDGYTTHLVTSVFYQIGGMNYASYKQEPRGYYISVRIVDRKRDEFSTIERFTMFSNGIKSFLEPAKMFSAKRLSLITVEADKISELRAKVMSQREEGRRAAV